MSSCSCDVRIDDTLTLEVMLSLCLESFRYFLHPFLWMSLPVILLHLRGINVVWCCDAFSWWHTSRTLSFLCQIPFLFVEKILLNFRSPESSFLFPFSSSFWHLVTVCSVAVISWGHTKSNERLGCNLLPSQISLKRERDGERENKDMIGICREAWETKQECLLLVNLISVSLSHLCCLLSQVLCRPHKWCKRHMDYLLWPRKLSGDLTRHQ